MKEENKGEKEGINKYVRIFSSEVSHSIKQSKIYSELSNVYLLLFSSKT